MNQQMTRTTDQTMNQATKFWHDIAEKYAKTPIADMPAYEYTLDRTRSYLKATDQVLEIGCGTGSTALALANTVEGITATDIAPGMTAIGKRKAKDQGVDNIRFLACDGFDDEIAADRYDVVMAFNMLHLVEQQRELIERARDLLKPGGLFISKTVCKPEKGFPIKFSIMMAVLPLMQKLGKAPFVKIGKIAELDAMISDTGFQIVETGNHPAQPPSRYIVARKS